VDLFLDKENGIDIGLKIKNLKTNCKIIIISSNQNYVMDGYKIKAERYFLKPIDEKQFIFEMKEIMQEYFYDAYGFIDKKISEHKIYIHEIVYIEYMNKCTILHCTDNRIYKTPYPLKYWIEKLNKLGFQQCYKSYVINKKYIDNINKADIVLKNKERIPLSRHYLKTLKSL
ncbi:MAG: DNA-binding response regulator, partial [Holdemanella sp.]|nr:DNA-binding response regulator [Holdemanella sp.]